MLTGSYTGLYTNLYAGLSTGLYAGLETCGYTSLYRVYVEYAGPSGYGGSSGRELDLNHWDMGLDAPKRPTKKYFDIVQRRQSVP